MVEVETGESGLWRKPSATAIPYTIDKRTYPRLYSADADPGAALRLRHLPPEQAWACRLPTPRSGHRSAENGNHLSWDVSLRVATCRIRTGHGRSRSGPARSR